MNLEDKVEVVHSLLNIKRITVFSREVIEQASKELNLIISHQRSDRTTEAIDHLEERLFNNRPVFKKLLRDLVKMRLMGHLKE